MAISSGLGSSALLPAGLGFRNVIINGGFDIWQRGTSFTNPASGGFTADRMAIVYDGSGATRTISQGQFDPYLSGASITATPPAGTSPTYFLRWNQSVAGTGANYNILYANRVENVRLLAGRTVTLSFYAKAGASLTMPSIDMEQSFGTGGSPSTTVYTTVASNVAVTTSWQRFTYTFAMPSAAGKVIGTDANSSYTSIRLWVPHNSTFVFDIWGVQLETNIQPTPFEQRPIGTELQLCQRYFQLMNSYMGTGDFNVMMVREVATQGAATIWLPVAMRIYPSIFGTSYGRCVFRDTSFGLAVVSVSSISMNSGGPSNNAVTIIITHGSVAGTFVYSEWDMNSTNASLGLSAEF